VAESEAAAEANAIQALVDRENADVICLQETKLQVRGEKGGRVRCKC